MSGRIVSRCGRFSRAERSAADSSFRFRALASPGSNVVTEIAYRRTRARRIDGTDYYRIDRYVDGVRAGGSMSTLVNWEITACNAQGMPVAAAENAREIVIRFEADNAAALERIKADFRAALQPLKPDAPLPY